MKASAPMARSTAPTSANRTGSWRFERPVLVHRPAPCSRACPAGEDPAGVELALERGAWTEAWARIRGENPFPAVCGRVCYHPCEVSCNRGSFDEPVAIRSLERHAADRARKAGVAGDGEIAPSTGRRVAVVGAGPAGLAAAHFLTRFGHEVDLFDARSEPGGALRWSIPEYRLPSETLAWEVSLALGAGTHFHGGRRLGVDLPWEGLSAFDAVFLATGAWTPARLDVPGQELALPALDLLEALRRGARPTFYGPVAVIGGGNTAIDAARVLVRLGAEPTIYYRRRLEDLPALAEEVEEALQEGVRFEPLSAPVRIEPARDGYRLCLQPMEASAAAPGSDGRASVKPSGAPAAGVSVTAVFAAVGGLPSDGLPARTTVPLSPHLAQLAVDGPTRVFLGGDLVNARRAVVTAIASGKEAALAIHAALEGRDPAAELAAARPAPDAPVSMALAFGGQAPAGTVVGPEGLNPAYFAHAARRSGALISPVQRRGGFAEVRRDLPEAAARAEAGRCFHCGHCDGCDNCYRYCPDLSVLRNVLAGTREIDYDHCKGCGICAEECPRGAIELRPE